MHRDFACFKLYANIIGFSKDLRGFPAMDFPLQMSLETSSEPILFKFSLSRGNKYLDAKYIETDLLQVEKD